MGISGITSGYNYLVQQKPHNNKASKTSPAFESNKLLKYTDLTKLAFSGQIAQVKPAEEENILDSVKVSPVEGLEHSKEWPLPIDGLKKLMTRFKSAQEYLNIPEETKPMVSVYNLSSHGRVYGVYDLLVNRLSLDEGIVLFDIDQKANIVDEALAHESYHCKRAQYFSRLSDEAVSKAIDNRLTQALTTGNVSVIEMMAGEKLDPLNTKAAEILVRESKISVDEEVKDTAVKELSEQVPEYDEQSLKFFIKTIRRLRGMYEKNSVIGHEPALKENLFDLEKFGKRVPDKVVKMTAQRWGLHRKAALKKIVEQKTAEIIMKGYISPTEAERARNVRKILQSQNPVEPGSEEETRLASELTDIFDMVDAAFNLQLSSINYKAKDLNRYKIQEDYIYSKEEINARQTGLKHKIALLNELLEKTDGDKKRSIQDKIKVANADYQLNETMIKIKELRKTLKESQEELPEVKASLAELTKQATELSKKATYTVPKVLGDKYQEYVPFSYGDSFRTTV